MAGDDRLIIADSADEVRRVPFDVSDSSKETRFSWIALLCCLAGVYTLSIARSFFIPLTVGLLFALSLMPLVRTAARFRIRPELSASLILSVIVGGVLLGVVQLSDPLREWVGTIPSSLNLVERKVRLIVQPVQQMTETAKRIERVAAPPVPGAALVTLRAPNLTERLIAVGQDVAGALGLTLLFLYFFLAYGEQLITNARFVFPVSKSGTDAQDVINDIGAKMSQYLLLVGAINICLGVAEWSAMGLLGMPNAALWGVMAGALNFIPYIGGLVGLATVATVSLVTFDSLHEILLPPLVYFIIDSFEGTFVTPTIVGHRFSINPAAGVVWLVFWGWLWGPVGAFIAMPMLMAGKIICDNVAALTPIGALLELRRGPSTERLSPIVTA